MARMESKPVNVDERCGACAHYEPSRDDRKYGYCKPHMALERDRRGHPHAHLTDVYTPCFMRSADWHSGELAFKPKEKK